MNRTEVFWVVSRHPQPNLDTFTFTECESMGDTLSLMSSVPKARVYRVTKFENGPIMLEPMGERP